MNVVSPNAGIAPDAAARVRGLALVAASAVIWSSGGLIVRSLETADSWTTILWRSLAAAAFLFLFMLARDGRAAPGLFLRMGQAGLFVGACFACASISLVVALSLTSVANVLVIMSASPLLAAVLSRVFLGEAVRPRTWAAIAATMAGIALMVSDSWARGAAAGDLLAMLISLATAAAIVVMRRHSEVRMTPAMCTATLIAAAAAAPFASPLAVGGDLPLLLLFGAGQLGLGLAMFASGARLAPAAEVALLATLEPILGPLWVWLVLAEQPGAAALAGGSVVLAALLLHTALDFRRRRPAPPIA